MRVRSLTLALALAGSACGEPVATTVPPPSAGPTATAEADDLAAILGPWRPAPIEVSEALTASLVDACVSSDSGSRLGIDVAQLPVALVDARGAGWATVVLADEHSAVLCEARIDEGGTSATIDEALARLAPDSTGPIEDEAIELLGYSVADAGNEPRTRVIGRVGRAVASVIADFDGGSDVYAARANGWFAAWWPGEVDAATIAAVDRLDNVRASIPAPADDLDPRVGFASWWVDPAAAPLDPGVTVIPALISERACASGTSPEGRVLEPQVFTSAEAVLVTVWVRHRPGGQDCPGNPTFAIEIDLGEPLGERRLLDGSEIPPRDATVPPD